MSPSDKELLHYNSIGILPGPNETEEDFQERANYSLHYSSELSNFLNTSVVLSSCYSQEFSSITQSLFGIDPQWIPIIFRNEGLGFFRAGCAWIVQLNDNDPTTAFFQLRSAFETSKNYLGIYLRNEILVHESGHAGRAMYEEPIFEEILAYRSSPSALRRWLGPIIQHHREANFFLLSLLIFVIGSLFLIDYFVWFSLIPLTLIVLGCGRLCYRQRQFKRCLKALNSFFNDSQKANAVIYRLTDEEIIALGQFSPNEITAYASNHAATSLRWRVLQLAYFHQK